MSPDDVVEALIDRNEHVLLPAGAPPAMLDDVAAQLAASRNRVLRPPALEVLTLPGLLAELAAQVPDPTLAAPDLERGFELLTDPGPDHQRIVLMLDRAGALDPAALRYIQFAAQGAPLRLVFADGPELRELLEREEFGLLRRRFAAFTPGSSPEPAPKPAPPATPSAAAPVRAWTAEGPRPEAFPGGAQAALEFAAFEKDLTGGGHDRDYPNKWHAPVSEPSRRSTYLLLAGAGMAVSAGATLLLISSGLLTSTLAVLLRTAASP